MSDEELTAAKGSRTFAQSALEAVLAWYLAIPAVRERLDAAYGLWQEETRIPPLPMLFLFSLSDKIVPAPQVSRFIEQQVRALGPTRACSAPWLV